MAETGRGAQPAEANEIAHESQGSRAPAAPHFRAEYDEALGTVGSSEYVASLRRIAVANAERSSSAERPCGWPSRDTGENGETKVALQHSAPPQRVMP